ncbi:MAG: acyltransferase family protein [Candidatus Latescibacteria bacterium]|nr:acyltransferase family protein [Candidatus Latescibacterota bacterium]
METSPTQRIFYMDNLRALAMLLGVLFHAALPYGPLMSEIWLVADPQNSWLMDFGAWLSHLFRMPLFFLIAGFFAHMLFDKRGAAGFLRHRAVRIAVPFILFLPLLTAAVVWVVVHALAIVETKAPLLQLMADNPNGPPPPFSTMHLWFLYHLFLFCLLATVGGLFLGGLLKGYIDRIFSHPLHLVYLPLLLIPSLFVNTAPLPAPEKIIPELWSFGYYGLFFLFGWQLFGRQAYLDLLAPYWKPMLGTGLVLYTGLYLLLPDITLASIFAPPSGYNFSLEHIVSVFLEAYAAVFLTLALLILGKHFLNRQSTGLRYIADASYWIYLVHLPVLWLVQVYLIDMELNIWLKFLVSSGATLLAGLISYALLVRHTPLGRLLNGRRKQVPAKPSATTFQPSNPTAQAT